jgi:hypothetical protein
LFDLENDPYELQNLFDGWRTQIGDPDEYGVPPVSVDRVDTVASDLRQYLYEWQTEVGDPVADATAERFGP